MTPLALPLPPDTWEALPAAVQALILAWQAQVVPLQSEVAAPRQTGAPGAARAAGTALVEVLPTSFH